MSNETVLFEEQAQQVILRARHWNSYNKLQRDVIKAVRARRMRKLLATKEPAKLVLKQAA